jgi:hypothetical protein
MNICTLSEGFSMKLNLFFLLLITANTYSMHNLPKDQLETVLSLLDSFQENTCEHPGSLMAGNFFKDRFKPIIDHHIESIEAIFNQNSIDYPKINVFAWIKPIELREQILLQRAFVTNKINLNEANLRIKQITEKTYFK